MGRLLHDNAHEVWIIKHIWNGSVCLGCSIGKQSKACKNCDFSFCDHPLTGVRLIKPSPKQKWNWMLPIMPCTWIKIKFPFEGFKRFLCSLLKPFPLGPVNLYWFRGSNTNTRQQREKDLHYIGRVISHPQNIIREEQLILIYKQITKEWEWGTKRFLRVMNKCHSTGISLCIWKKNMLPRGQQTMWHSTLNLTKFYIVSAIPINLYVITQQQTATLASISPSLKGFHSWETLLIKVEKYKQKIISITNVLLESKKTLRKGRFNLYSKLNLTDIPTFTHIILLQGIGRTWSQIIHPQPNSWATDWNGKHCFTAAIIHDAWDSLGHRT